MSEARVIHISTYSVGGAANAAIRLHFGLLKVGTDSLFLSLHPSELDIPKHQVFPRQSKYGISLKNRIARKIGLSSSPPLMNDSGLKAIASQIECFSSPVTDFRLAEYLHDRYEFDIVNLHWVANFLDYEEFFRKINRPVIWTLHDQHPFSSYWHYSDDHLQEAHAIHVHEKSLKMKEEALKFHSQALHIVAPSKWLTEDSRNSKLFMSYPHHHIPYGIDTSIFKEQQDAPSSIDPSKFRAGAHIGVFICQTISNKRKGMQILSEALGMIPSEIDIQFIAIGHADEKMRSLMPEDTIFTGEINNDLELAKLYNRAEFTVIPSLQDNLPNTMLESLCCGTSVIGTPAGGIPEVVCMDGFGTVTKDLSPASLKDAIISFVGKESHQDRNAISSSAIKLFNLKEQAEAYRRLYANILAS
jgi:glycosyltransferase involved in cell wall biosynthesis